MAFTVSDCIQYTDSSLSHYYRRHAQVCDISLEMTIVVMKLETKFGFFVRSAQNSPVRIRNLKNLPGVVSEMGRRGIMERRSERRMVGRRGEIGEGKGIR
jgi:hypothetical protein